MKICKLSVVSLLTVLTLNVKAQSEQAGIELASSFPQITQGNVEPDLPSEGFYWDKDDSGWGVAIELQSRDDTASGYFLFGTGYFFREDGSQFWCAFSDAYKPNLDVHQWRDQKQFSNLPHGHNEQSLMAEQIVACHVKSGGTALGSSNHQSNHTDEIINLKMVWRNPSELEITPDGGVTHYTARFGFHDDLRNPSLDWVMDYEWVLQSSVGTYTNDSNEDERTTKRTYNQNMVTRFETLNVSEQEELRDYIGHKSSNHYYISTIKNSDKIVSYSNISTSLGLMFEPYVNGGGSNRSWVVLVHDSERGTVSLYTVAGNKTPGDLRPDAGIDIKFVTKVNPDADVLDFYPRMCEGESFKCDRTARTYRNSDMANWSPQNVHRSTMKMFKLKTGGKAYLYQPNTGESDSQAMGRIKQQLVDGGVLEN